MNYAVQCDMAQETLPRTTKLTRGNITDRSPRALISRTDVPRLHPTLKKKPASRKKAPSGDCPARHCRASAWSSQAIWRDDRPTKARFCPAGLSGRGLCGRGASERRTCAGLRAIAPDTAGRRFPRDLCDEKAPASECVASRDKKGMLPRENWAVSGEGRSAPAFQ